MSYLVEPFTIVDSEYGRFIVNRYCYFQAETLLKTGKTHIEGELDVIRTIVNTLPQGCTVLDGGANIGFFSVPIAQFIKSRGGVVHAFEPQRMIFNALAGTVALNSIDNLYVKHQALGEKQGVAYVPAVDYSQSRDFGMVELSDQAEGEAVAVVSVDELQLEGLDFFKLDVEGYEIHALNGAYETLKKFEPWCWVEYWKIGHEPILQCFHDLDYRFYIMDKLNLLCVPQNRLKKMNTDFNVYAQEVTL